jgi:hypothetical protein
MLAATATRMHLRALTRYANVSEEAVQIHRDGGLAEWCAIGGVTVPTP